MTKRKIALSEDLEAAIMAALLKGLASREVVDPAELSKPGRIVLQALNSLADGGAKAPFPASSVLLTSTEVFGASKEATAAYLRKVAEVNVDTDVSDILGKVRDKQVLVDLINAAGEQLQKGTMDVGLLGGYLQKDTTGGGRSVLPISELIRDGLPEPPKGLALSSLPYLTKASGGIYGLWAIGGEPKVGKSTLAWQIALDTGRHTPVLYYDFENGFPVLMDRTRNIFGGDLARIRRATTRVYYRDGIRTLDSDLAAVPSPALVVIDSVQKLPASMEYRRTGLDRWMHRLELLKKRGYHVLLVSEVGRANYGHEPSISAYKETGEIEYTADFGAQVIPGTGDLVELHVVANRHKPFKGFLEHLMRKNDWSFRESTDEPNQGATLD